MTPAELKELRELIAIEKGIKLFREYTEADAAAFLDCHPRTLADYRRNGTIHCLKKSARNISYFGMHIVDYMIASNTAWENTQIENTSLESGILPKEGKAQRGTGADITSRNGEPSAFQLAQTALKKPSKD